MCRIPTARQSNKALRRAGPTIEQILSVPPEALLAECTLPALPADTEALMPDLEAELLETDDPLGLFDFDEEEEGEALPPDVKAEQSSGSQEPTTMVAPQFVPMQQFFMYPADMYGFNAMHQPMPVVPPQFIPQNTQPLTVQQPAPAAETALAAAGYGATQQPQATTGHSRRHKTPEEIAAQEERVKKRRRESAQRSRQRKNCYVKNLEFENKALKAENEKLRALLAQLDGGLRVQQQSSSPPTSFIPKAEVSLHSAA